MLYDEFEAAKGADPANPKITLVVRAEHSGEVLLLQMFAQQMGVPVYREGSYTCCKINE